MAFPARFDLDTLDGSNGFAVRGDDRFGNLGISVSIAGDVNGDGFDDVIIGAPADGQFLDSDDRGFAFGSVDKVGKSYVVFGDASGLPAEVNGDALDDSNGFVVNGIEQRDFSGRNVSGAGDINGDGLADVIIDRRFVVFGNSSGFPSEVALADLDGVNGFVLDGYVDGLDTLAVGGDLNGDGIDDLVLGDPGRYTRVPRTNERLPPETPGKTYVVFGTTDGFSPRVDVDGLNGDDGVVIAGINAADLAGSSLSAEGDVNGDGLDDLIIGAPGAGAHGETYVVFGSASGFADDLELGDLDGSNGFVVTGRVIEDSTPFIKTEDFAGIAGDFNGDGIDDVFVNNSEFPAESYIVFGRSDGFAARVDLGELSASDGVVIDDAVFGYDFALIGAGDINGDGFDDLLATLWNNVRTNPYGTYVEGVNSTYVVFGRSSGEDPRISLDALDGRDGFLLSRGGSVTAAGDINGDGYDDLVVAVVDEPFEESYVVFGASGGFDAEIDPRNVDGIDGFILDRWAKSTDGRGDINGDGIEDFIIGTGNYGRYSATSGGKAFVVFGSREFGARVPLAGEDQVIVGTDAAEALSGGVGDDSLLGGLGNDTLDGGPGDDRLVGDGARLEFVGASGFYDSVLGYVDPETGAATVVIENADAQAAAGFSTLLDLPGDAIWFLVPNGARLNADVAAGGGYRLAGDADSGFFIETEDGAALNGSLRGDALPLAYFSDPALNVDGKGHVRQLADGTLAWEDWINQGDRDFDDVVVKLTDTDGADVFVLGPGDGTDAIADFQLGLDRICLKGGLSFADLAFADEAIVAGGEVLALLTGIDTTTLTEADFVLV